MSRQFNDTTNLNGLVQLYEEECGMEEGFISDNATRLKQVTARINSALDRFFSIAIQASGTWQLDDSNHSDYPIIKTNLVSGQRDYSFTVDGNSNLILDVYKVAVLPSATATLFQELTPFDEFEHRDNDIITENTVTGTPSGYAKLANAIHLDVPTNYNATNGMKVYINREADYFTSSDTTQKPGVPGLFHDYFFLEPAMAYARINLSDSQYTKLARTVAQMEADIKEYFNRREKDLVPVMRGEEIIFK